MALTAEQITAQNFKDFYTQILPYLNKGNGGTSDTPLGQVAFFDDVVAPAGWLIADGTVYNISDYPDLANQYERVHGSKNFYGGNGTTTFAVPDWDAIPAEVFGNSNIICVKAVPSSEMNTYSTTERRVGTWIDGKPLYQKTINGTVPSGSANTVVTLADLSTISYENMIIDSGYVNYGSDNKHIVPLPSGNDTEGNVWIGDNNLLRFKSSSGEHYNRPFAVTLKYTKTTD